jgi:hypothetical protein
MASGGMFGPLSLASFLLVAFSSAQRDSGQTQTQHQNGGVNWVAFESRVAVILVDLVS